jgi:hypothetical protein
MIAEEDGTGRLHHGWTLLHRLDVERERGEASRALNRTHEYQAHPGRSRPRWVVCSYSLRMGEVSQLRLLCSEFGLDFVEDVLRSNFCLYKAFQYAGIGLVPYATQ